MLFHSSIRKELSRSFVATLVVLVTVVMSMMLIRSLGLAARGSVNPRDVIMLMGYSVLGHLGTIITLSLFIAVTSTLARMYRDSEMAVWFASGQGLSGFLRPIFRFSWPMLIVIAVLALFVWPWAAQQTTKLRQVHQQRGDLERVSLGQFQENASGSRVFFVEATAADPALGASASSSSKTDTIASLKATQARNVFISQTENGKQVITTARTGRIDTINGDQFLVLGHGQRMEQDMSNAEVKISEFEEYSVLVNARQLEESTALPPKSMRTIDLIRNPTNLHMAELSWRLGLACAAVNLLVLALLLAATNPRAGRGYGLTFALLTFVIYYNLLNVGYIQIANGKVSLLSWMLLMHGGLLTLVLLWLSARHAQWSWRNMLPAKASNTSA